MAIITKILPVYYTTLQSEYGLSFSQIQELDAKNQVYILEMGKADGMKQKGYSDSQVIGYFQSQGYNSIQIATVQTYLNNRLKTDATGATEKSKLDKTIADIQKVSTAVLPIWESIAKIFGIGGNSLNQIVIPDLATYKAPTSNGLATVQVDTGKDKITGSSDVDIKKPVFSFLGIDFTGNTIVWGLVAIVGIWLLTSNNKSMPKN